MGFVKIIQTTKADMTRAEEIMCHQRDEKFADAQEKRPIKAKLGGKIELKNVSFGYSL